MNFKLRVTGLALAFLSMSALAACGNATPQVRAKELHDAKVHVVGSAEKLKSLYTDAYSSQYNYYWDVAEGGMSSVTATPDATSSAGSSHTGATSSSEDRDYEGTNEQVEGVAEADIVKTDGYQIYYAARYENKIRVLDVADDHGISVGNVIDLGSVYTDSLYLTDKYLVVIGYRYDIQQINCDTTDDGEVAYCLSMMWWQPTGTAVIIDRATLTIAYELQTDSYFMDHRLIDNTLFLVGYRYGYSINDELRPYFNEIRGENEDKTYLSYDSIYYIDDTPAYGMRVLTGLKLADDANDIFYQSSAYLGQYPDYNRMYVNLENLYLTDTVYHWDETSYYTRMTITQFALDTEAAGLTYVASVIVDGATLNQFSMDEYNGYLRVATTDVVGTQGFSLSYGWYSWTQTITNHLYILAMNGESGFDLVGQLKDGLGETGESIKSVRFMGDSAYIVTFRQTDPLYIIDLSDPANPAITDAIHQNGFDTYQHEWGENRLIGIGYDTNSGGQTTGLKISAYDTTSGAASALQTYTLLTYQSTTGSSSWTYGYSEALWNPKALLVSTAHGLLGFSVQAYEYGYNETTDPSGSSSEASYSDWYWRYHSYYYIFHIDFDSDTPISDPIIIEHETADDYYVAVDRGVYINGYVYTISNRGVVTYDVNENEILADVLRF